MKRWAFMVSGWLLAVSAGAQFAGLPVADTAPAATGETRISAGAVLGDDFNLFGGESFTEQGADADAQRKRTKEEGDAGFCAAEDVFCVAGELCQ